ncbi:PREDICTED: uncharacterized protein LOC109243376 [Nicotiana attenuata]|uniref:uncharacterized protein LOC109243376 n=1 Tax=Nicotiana attenuata TaxID=49451 RepID=UPI000905C1DB|nr:PREDICTED: uncharacterized protein LOC109243376 [Nicotiana attenuata]
MRSVTIKVRANIILLRKSGQADTWLEPLIGPIEKAKLESYSNMTLLNDIMHASLKANLIGTELMTRVSLLEKLARDLETTAHDAEEVARGSQLEANNWKGQFESAKIDMENLEKRKSTLEKQVQALASELATIKATSDQTKKEKERLESSFSEQLSKVNEENRALKTLLAQKEIHTGELAQDLSPAQEELRASVDKIHALENSHTTLQSSYSSVLAKNEVATWEKDYELLKELTNIEVSWTFLKSHRDTLVEMGQENFNLESELAKVNEAIERAQQP